jgi:hypothetical protein
LRRAKKWEVGDGYGFTVCTGLPASPITLLKLHGSTNWNDLMFGGKGIAHSLGPLQALGQRPVIFPQDFEFFEYTGVADPDCLDGSYCRVGSMILPGRRKVFYVQAPGDAPEREEFRDSLWTQAEDALRSAAEINVIGYSLPQADERARNLILSKATQTVCVSVCSGSDSDSIGNEFRRCGFKNVSAVNGHFEDWLREREL